MRTVMSCKKEHFVVTVATREVVRVIRSYRTSTHVSPRKKASLDEQKYKNALSHITPPKNTHGVTPNPRPNQDYGLPDYYGLPDCIGVTPWRLVSAVSVRWFLTMEFYVEVDLTPTLKRAKGCWHRF